MPEKFTGPMAQAILTTSQLERVTERKQFLIPTSQHDQWIIASRIPYMGTWYDSGGIQHGGAASWQKKQK